MKYIDINLRGAREPCTSYIIGSAGENIAEAFRAWIPDKYLNCDIVFEFQMENGEKHSSKLLPWAKEIIFEVPYYLMEKGRMVVAITATDKTSKAIYRLFEKTFVVVTSISKQPMPIGLDIAALAQKLKGLETVQTLPETPEADAIVYLNGAGIYHFTGTEWEALTDNGRGLDEFELLVEALRQDLPTAVEIERWNAAAGAKHSHENKPSLDKLLVSETFVGLPDGAETGSVGIVTGIDTVSKSIAQYDAATDAQTPVTIAPSLVYNAAAQMDDAVMVIDTKNDDVGIALLPVYTPDVSDPASGGAGMILVTEQTNPKKYMVIVGPDVTLARADLIADFNIDDPGEDVLFVYAFETVTGDLKSAEEENENEYETIAENVQIAQGWNAVFLTENGVFISALADPNAYCDLGEFGSIDTDAPQHPYLYDVLRLVTTEDKRGIYHFTGTEWEALTDSGTRLAELANTVSAMSDDIPSSEDVAKWDDAAEKRHTHENKTTLDRFAGDATSVQYNGYDVSLLPKDDVVLLGLHEYNDLVVRDDVINGETIQDVPFYTTDTIELVDTTSTYMHPDSIRFVRIVDNGYIYLQIRAYIANHMYIHEGGGWQSSDPVFSEFTPNAYRVYRAGELIHTEQYASIEEMPLEAKSLLRSFSQCINVSADAMGEIRYDPDAVEVFRGNEILPNHKYHLTIGEDFGIILPTMDEPEDWTEKDLQFVIYLTCTSDIDVYFGNVLLAGGNAPNTDTGNHKIIGTFLRDEHIWSIGGIDYEEMT